MGNAFIAMRKLRRPASTIRRHGAPRGVSRRCVVVLSGVQVVLDQQHLHLVDVIAGHLQGKLGQLPQWQKNAAGEWVEA